MLGEFLSICVQGAVYGGSMGFELLNRYVHSWFDNRYGTDHYLRHDNRSSLASWAGIHLFYLWYIISSENSWLVLAIDVRHNPRHLKLGCHYNAARAVEFV